MLLDFERERMVMGRSLALLMMMMRLHSVSLRRGGGGGGGCLCVSDYNEMEFRVLYRDVCVERREGVGRQERRRRKSN